MKRKVEQKYDDSNAIHRRADATQFLLFLYFCIVLFLWAFISPIFVIKKRFRIKLDLIMHKNNFFISHII